MAFTTRASLSRTAYETQRYALIKYLEEGGNVSLKSYIDTEQARIPTIGLGFNIEFNLEAILKAMGVNSPLATEESRYFERLLVIAKSRSYHDTAADEVRLQADLNKVMADRAADPNITGPKPVEFKFGDEGAVQSVFNTIAETYDDKIVAWETKAGIVPVEPGKPSLRYSPELMVLFSLAYNNGGKGGNSLLGERLAAAIKTDDRAEAWFQIR